MNFGIGIMRWLLLPDNRDGNNISHCIIYSLANRYVPYVPQLCGSEAMIFVWHLVLFVLLLIIFKLNIEINKSGGPKIDADSHHLLVAKFFKCIRYS